MVSRIWMLRGPLLQKRFDPQFMDDLARSRKSFVAIVDDNWLGLYGGTPRQWALAGRWKFNDRVVLAPPALSFYALTEAARLQLVENLRDFSSRLPAGVEQLGPYMEACVHVPSAVTIRALRHHPFQPIGLGEDQGA